MADDIVTRLRQILDPEMSPTEQTVVVEAADEIERLQALTVALRAEIQRLEQVNRG